MENLQSGAGAGAAGFLLLLLLFWGPRVVGFLDAIITEWVIRVAPVGSLFAHVVLALLAGVRRREATSPGTLVLWVASLVADWVATAALAKLTFGSTPREQQLVALWLPFFLIHLGGPDNITALSLEDNKLSKREVVKTLFKLLGTVFAMYKQYVAVTGIGPLLWASFAMLVIGVFKYLERAIAFREADLDKIRNSPSNSLENQRDSLRIQPSGEGTELVDEQALLLAHELLHITRGAFADYSVHEDPFQNDNNLKEIFTIRDSSGWKNMCKVVEMEVSLMYDIIYTKAALAHTWIGYFVRVASPIATTATAFLFWLSYNKDGQRTADVVITYALLIVTILLDVRWLLRAAASTWTYAFLNSMPECWLHHEVLCTGRWRQLRLAVMALDMREWLLHKGRCGSYRLWSGTIGQYNLFDKCTDGDTNVSLISKAVKKVVADDTWIEYNYSKDLDLHKEHRVNEWLFWRIERAFDFESLKRDTDDRNKAVRPLDEALGFLPELQELILILHIATNIFLWYNHQELMEGRNVETIKAVSNYLVFLAVARPDMLPGLKLRSDFDLTRDALDKIWGRKGGSSPGSTGRQQKLAGILIEMKDSTLYKENLILSDATKFAKMLQKCKNGLVKEYWKKSIVRESRKKFLFMIPEMAEWIHSIEEKEKEGSAHSISMNTLLNSILDSWVRMLIYVSTRCGRDSHAKQLGRGGELTTIVWMLRDHAAIFGNKGRERKARFAAAYKEHEDDSEDNSRRIREGLRTEF